MERLSRSGHLAAIVLSAVAAVTPPAHARPGGPDRGQTRHGAPDSTRFAGITRTSASSGGETAPLRYTAAPVPDEELGAPPDFGANETSVIPAFMQIHYPSMGDGYTPGSSAQSKGDSDAARAAGLRLIVPLGQR